MSTPTVAETLAKLAAGGLAVPKPGNPVASYRTAVATDRQVQTAGHLPMREGAVAVTGLVGSDVGVEAAGQGAGLATLGAIASAASVVPEQTRWQPINVVVYVAAGSDFTEHPQVANGASEVLAAAFDEPPARSAVGVASLPLNASVEVAITFATVNGTDPT